MSQMNSLTKLPLWLGPTARFRNLVKQDLLLGSTLSSSCSTMRDDGNPSLPAASTASVATHQNVSLPPLHQQQDAQFLQLPEVHFGHRAASQHAQRSPSIPGTLHHQEPCTGQQSESHHDVRQRSQLLQAEQLSACNQHTPAYRHLPNSHNSNKSYLRRGSSHHKRCILGFQVSTNWSLLTPRRYFASKGYKAPSWTQLAENIDVYLKRATDEKKKRFEPRKQTKDKQGASWDDDEISVDGMTRKALFLKLLDSKTLPELEEAIEKFRPLVTATHFSVFAQRCITAAGVAYRDQALKLLDKFCTELPDVLVVEGKPQLRAIGDILHAYAYLGKQPPPKFDQVAMLPIAKESHLLADLTSHTIAKIAMACARIGYTHAGVWDALVTAGQNKVSKMEPRTLSNMLWAVCHAKDVERAALFEAAALHVLEFLDDYNPRDLAQVLASFARAGFFHPKLIRELMQAVKRHIQDFDGMDLALVLEAFASLGPDEVPKALKEGLAKSAIKHLQEMEAEKVAKVAVYFSKLQYQSKDLTRALTNALLKRTQYVPPNRLLVALQALADSGYNNKQFYEKIITSLEERLPELTLSGVCALLSVCHKGQAGGRELMLKAVKGILEGPPGYSQYKHWGQLVSAMHDANLYDAPLLDKLCDAYLEYLKHCHRTKATQLRDEGLYVNPHTGRLPRSYLESRRQLAEAANKVKAELAGVGVEKLEQLDFGLEQGARPEDTPIAIGIASFLVALGKLRHAHSDVLRVACDVLLLLEAELGLELSLQLLLVLGDFSTAVVKHTRNDTRKAQYNMAAALVPAIAADADDLKAHEVAGAVMALVAVGWNHAETYEQLFKSMANRKDLSPPEQQQVMYAACLAQSKLQAIGKAAEFDLRHLVQPICQSVALSDIEAEEQLFIPGLGAITPIDSHAAPSAGSHAAHPTDDHARPDSARWEDTTEHAETTRHAPVPSVVRHPVQQEVHSLLQQLGMNLYHPALTLEGMQLWASTAKHISDSTQEHSAGSSQLPSSNHASMEQTKQEAGDVTSISDLGSEQGHVAVQILGDQTCTRNTPFYMLGSVFVQHEYLRRSGWPVVTVPLKVWKLLDTELEKKQFLSNRLQVAGIF